VLMMGFCCDIMACQITIKNWIIGNYGLEIWVAALSGSDLASEWVEYFQVDMDGIGRKDTGRPIWPFHQAERATIEAVFYTGTQGLFFIPEAV
jgi:hypothetical protein